MMKSKKYYSLRALLQLVSLIIILANVIQIALLFSNYKIHEIEAKVMEQKIFSFFDIAYYITSMNIIFSLFISCGITCKANHIINLCSLCLKIFVFLALLIAFYLSNFYHSKFNLELSTVGSVTGSVTELIVMRTSITHHSEAFALVSREIKDAVSKFCFVEYCVIFAQILQIFFISYLLSIKLKEPQPEEIPVFKVTKMGLNTESIQSKRVIEVVDD